MKRPPYSPRESIFSHGVGRDILVIGLGLMLITLGVAYFAWKGGIEQWRTMAFTTLTLAQMGNVLALRSNKGSLFTQGVFSNMSMIWAVLLTILLQVAVIYIPFLQTFFGTMPLTVGQFGVCLLATLAMFFLVELVKLLERKRLLSS